MTLTRRATSPKPSTADPQLAWLKPSELEVEPIAQRGFEPKWAEKLADEWDEEKLGVLEVAERNGHFYVTDGQHRRAVLLKQGRGNEPVACIVYTHEDVADDAKRYVAGNIEKRRPNPIDAFRINVVAKDPESVAIDSVLGLRGLRFSWGSGDNDISAVSAVQWVYRKGGTKLLDRTLDTIEKTWGRDRSSRDGNVLKAFALLLDKRGSVLDVDSLADKISKDSTAARLLGTARAHKMATGKALYLQTAEVMLTIYNRGRSTRRVSL